MGLRVKAAALAVSLLLPFTAYSQDATGGNPHPAEEPEVEYFFSTRERVTLGVMGLESGGGISQEQVNIIGDIIAEHISKLGDVRVVSKADIISMLNLEKQKRLAGCTDKECFSEIAGTLGMPWMLTGNMSIMGESIILNLKLIDVRNAYVAGRATRRIRGDLDDLLDELPEATEELFEKVGERLGFAMRANEVKSASKNRQSIFWSPSAVTVLTQEDIQSSGANLMQDLLRRVPGFDVYTLKTAYPLVGARALTDESNNLILVLIDGREAIVELAGNTFWSGLSIELSEIERIEIIRGPGSALYGANAFAAVVNITTVSDSHKSEGLASLSAGEGGFLCARGMYQDSLSLENGVMSYSVALSTLWRRDFADIRQESMVPFRSHGILRYQKQQKLDLSLHTGFVSGVGLFYTHIGDMHMNDTYNYWVMGKGEFALGQATRLKAQIYYSFYRPTFRARSNLSAYDIWIADFPEFFLDSPVADGQVQLDFQILDDLLVIGGANLRYISLHCETYDPKDISELRGAGFVHAQWAPLDVLQLTGGLRLDLSTEIEPALSPRAVVVFRPWRNHSFRLGYGLAFRKPSLYESRIHVVTERFNPATPEIVDKLPEVLGNEDLRNEKVHSFEAGWMGHFADARLQLSLDLFFNIYRDTILFMVDIKERLGLPDITNSTIRYENMDGEIHALGGEAEAAWRPGQEWRLWCNLGVRRVTGEEPASEPILRVNLGGRYSPSTGLTADLALHYVSAYDLLLTDPENILNEREPFSLGNNLLLVGRLGYRVRVHADLDLEAGLTIRTPLGQKFREYPGTRMPSTPQAGSMTSWGGNVMVRWISFYLKGSF
jgi:outer membrane receptor protein involved in Fe transport